MEEIKMTRESNWELVNGEHTITAENLNFLRRKRQNFSMVFSGKMI